MKYVILIHSNPQPWGHPTSLNTAEGRVVGPDVHAREASRFEAVMTEISESGEFVTAEALADPSSATLYRWTTTGHVATDGPFAEAKEYLAGLFIIDCESRQRAEQIATRFAQPGDVVELRPAMWPGGDDQ
jgi:hypothetical protein